MNALTQLVAQAHVKNEVKHVPRGYVPPKPNASDRAKNEGRPLINGVSHCCGFIGCYCD